MSGEQTITVAAGQLSARLMNEAPATLEAIERAIRVAAQKRVDLLVLPECAYPAYLLGSITSYRGGDHLSTNDFLAWLAERAARYRLHIISGFVEDTGASVYNAAVFLSDQGKEIGRTRKRFLWHVDHDWFSPGEELRALDSAIGRVGIVICAELRDPELVASLVADGAELLALPTCWINGSREPGQFYNPQVEFLVEARAREFGVPLVCADKSGLEMTTGYVGQSRIVRADGSVAAEAPPTGEAVVAARLVRRRPGRVWVAESRKSRLLTNAPPVRPPLGAARAMTVAVLPTAVANGRLAGGNGGSATDALASLQRRGVRLLLANIPQESSAEQMVMLAGAYEIHAVGFPHRADAFALGPVRVGCLAGQWLRSFGAARALALDGAEILMCFDAPPDLPTLRSRALENRVFVLAAGERFGAVIDPDGQILARTGPENPSELVIEINAAAAADKLVAPKTDLFDERRPGLYRF